MLTRAQLYHRGTASTVGNTKSKSLADLAGSMKVDHETPVITIISDHSHFFI